VQVLDDLDAIAEARAEAVHVETIGFTVTGTHADDGEMSWARLSFGTTDIMLNEGGRSSDAFRREVDLYVQTAYQAAVFRTSGTWIMGTTFSVTVPLLQSRSRPP
jgi:hypothetical protein